VLMLERFARRLGGSRVMSARVWRTALGRQWASLGGQMRRSDRTGEAAWCYRRAIRVAPWLSEAWRGYVSSRFRNKATEPSGALPSGEAPL